MHINILFYFILFNFRDINHLSMTAVPLLIDLEKTIENNSCIGSEKKKKSVEVVKKKQNNDISLTLFSGHDITIFTLLYALRADIIGGTNSCTSSSTNNGTSSTIQTQSWTPYWPIFGKYVKCYNSTCRSKCHAATAAASLN